MPEGLRIELATEADVPRMLEISNWAALNTPANFATEPEPLGPWLDAWRSTHEFYPWLVARRGGMIAGFAKAGPHKARAAYNWTAEVSVYIDPAHHGQGIGRALYDALIPVLAQQGYVTLIAGITTGNKASERLHASVGFRHCATFHRAGWKFSKWHDVNYYELHLQPPDQTPQQVRSVAAAYGV